MCFLSSRFFLLQATEFETLPFSDSGRGFLACLGSGLAAEGTCFVQRRLPGFRRFFQGVFGSRGAFSE